MKNKSIITSILIAILTLTVLSQSCAPSKMIAQKSGAQLWGENCIRCHNLPSPTDFNDVQWATIGLHMEDRASLTETEAEKIIDFMKSAN